MHYCILTVNIIIIIKGTDRYPELRLSNTLHYLQTLCGEIGSTILLSHQAKSWLFSIALNFSTLCKNKELTKFKGVKETCETCGCLMEMIMDQGYRYIVTF